MPGNEEDNRSESEKQPIIIPQAEPGCSHENRISINMDISELTIDDIDLKNGIHLYHNGLIDEAMAALKKYLSKFPDNTEAHLILGDIYERKMMYDEAVIEYSEVLRLNEKDDMTRFKLENALKQRSMRK
ncbi:cytochrome C biosynthesis protein [Methanocella sp. CWC-04]|uniref:Cytochrome C biosynthesis protein n=1 Tax=Methanooceanicella nereidis TaxID=2052831 RepID=A0AAP2W6H9_9EURY|nr:tetratricopeptide repeat protein [Methanocella sp. CWC-04]MCD1295287.1 cytochrome C biosynthesis protein [Methanocella sp. CWC-04]